MEAIKVWNSATSAEHSGTVSCLVRWLNRPGLLSASHVLSPVWYGVSVGANHSITISLVGNSTRNGELANWDVPMTADGAPVPSSRDAAYATIDTATETSLATAIGLPAGVRTAQYEQKVFFYGAKTGLHKQAVIQDLSASVVMGYTLYDTQSKYYPVDVPLSGLIQCDSQEPTDHGDSGCLMFDSDGYAMGLLVGTDSANAYRYFTHLQPILDLFGVQLVTTADYPQAPRLKDLI
jgi:hypothetical protein